MNRLQGDEYVAKLNEEKKDRKKTDESVGTEPVVIEKLPTIGQRKAINVG